MSRRREVKKRRQVTPTDSRPIAAVRPSVRKWRGVPVIGNRRISLIGSRSCIYCYNNTWSNEQTRKEGAKLTDLLIHTL